MMYSTALAFFLFVCTSPLPGSEPSGYAEIRPPSKFTAYSKPKRLQESAPVNLQKSEQNLATSAPVPPSVPAISRSSSNSNTLSNSSLAESGPLPPPLTTLPPPSRPPKHVITPILLEPVTSKQAPRPQTVTIAVSSPVSTILALPRHRSPAMPATQVRLPTQEEDPLAPLLPIALGDISFTSLQLKKILQNGGAFQVVPGKGIRSIIDNQWPIETLKKRVVWVKEEGEIDGYWLDGSLSLCRELNQLERSNRLASISWHPTQEDTHEARIYINQKPTKWHICLLSTESEYRKWIRICQLKRWAKEYLSGESSPIFFPHPTKIQYMILAKGPLHSTPFNSRLDWDFFKVWNDQTTTEPPQLTKLAQQLQRRLILMKAEIHHPLPNAALRWFDNPPRRGNAYFIRMKAKDWEEEKEFCATYEPWNELSYFRHRKYRRWLTAAAADS